MNTCILVIKEDSKNEINRKITSFLCKNMESLIYDHQILIQYERLSGNKKYKGVSRCPTLIVGKKRLEGNEILSYLNNPSSEKSQKAPQRPAADESDWTKYQDSLIRDLSDPLDDRNAPTSHTAKLELYTKDRVSTDAQKPPRIPGRYDSVCQKLNGTLAGDADTEAPPHDSEYLDDFGDFDSRAPSDEYHSYAMQQF